MFLDSCKDLTDSKAGERYVEAYTCGKFSKSPILCASSAYVSVDKLRWDVFGSACLAELVEHVFCCCSFTGTCFAID